MIRVLVADDQALVRAGIRMLIETQPDLEVVGEAADGLAAIGEATRSSPDVVLMDIRMPRLDGIEAARRILALGPSPARVVMLTTFDLDEYVFDAMSAGASGFLLKHAPPEELLFGIRAAADGHALVAPALTRRLIERSPGSARRAAPELERLTEREREVLVLWSGEVQRRDRQRDSWSARARSRPTSPGCSPSWDCATGRRP